MHYRSERGGHLGNDQSHFGNFFMNLSREKNPRSDYDDAPRAPSIKTPCVRRRACASGLPLWRSIAAWCFRLSSW